MQSFNKITSNISIHTPHAGSDLSGFFYSPKKPFQSTLPMRGATACYHLSPDAWQISIHTPHAGSDMYIPPDCELKTPISIHTPHAGSDLLTVIHHLVQVVISIHTPHAGSDARRSATAREFTRISIHTPHAGSDRSPTGCRFQNRHFNPHSPCGERRPRAPCLPWR